MYIFVPRLPTSSKTESWGHGDKGLVVSFTIICCSSSQMYEISYVFNLLCKANLYNAYTHEGKWLETTNAGWDDRPIL